MERGLFWLPLLILFFGLTWSGWNEYQKLQAYQAWAAQFEHAKYDIYAVLGQNGNSLTWGMPTRTGPVSLQTFSLETVEKIQLLVNGRLESLDTPPSRGKAALEFLCSNHDSIQVPFTDPALAAKWGLHLQKNLVRFQLPIADEPMG